MTDEPEKTDPAAGESAPATSDAKADALPPRAQAQAAPPANETPEEKKARLARVIAEAKAKKEAAATQGGGAPAPAAKPATSDAEKAARIAEAKAKAAALKASAGEKTAAANAAAPPATPTAAGAAAGAPKAPVKKKEDAPAPKDASAHPLVKRLRARFGDGITEATEFLNQLSIRVARSSIVEVCDALKRDAETPFNYLSDLTCVHYPDNFDEPFEIVYNLLSLGENARVRLKVSVAEGGGVASVTNVWSAANWMEREVFDLFGVKFENHPDLRRILLPPDWKGHPLRKDYPLEFVENGWTAKHLPEFDGVQQEQLAQRRAYELELLSTPNERRVRDIFRAGKEVMPKEHK
jgi:NADH-quinone oxidoreductase subunit C